MNSSVHIDVGTVAESVNWAFPPLTFRFILESKNDTIISQVRDGLFGAYWPVLPRTAPYCPVLPRTAPYCPVLSRTAPYCPVLPRTAPYCPVLPRTALYCPVRPCTALYCPVLPRTVLYCPVPYCHVKSVCNTGQSTASNQPEFTVIKYSKWINSKY